MKVALVHDYLVERGGAEHVLAVLWRAFPDAPIYTSVYNPETTLDVFRGADVRPSFLQQVTVDPGQYRALLPLYPLAFASFDLRDYDLIISSSSGFAKGVRKPAGARHVCYCHTPPRFIWGYQRANERERLPAGARAALALARPLLRRADRWGARGVDRFLANSRCVATRIAEVYGRASDVVPPPVDCDAFAPGGEAEDFYLVVSRLVPYKRVDVVVEAFNRSDRRLLIAGAGRDRARLEAMARSRSIRFLGHAPQGEVRRLLARCRALIVAAEEDFGLTALEANASGRPVIAFGAGGALETVVPGVTGVTFAAQTPEALLDALSRFEQLSFAPDTLVEHARRFDVGAFRRRIEQIVAEEIRPGRADVSRAPLAREEAAT
jgi:glycosyltransferase involved in cell wall biosynthesis